MYITQLFWKEGPLLLDLDSVIQNDFVVIFHNEHSVIRSTLTVMNIKWDYNYYQPWSDNEWLVDKMLAMLDKDIIMQ